MRRRVVVTGLGVVAANGVGLTQFLQGLHEGRSGIVHDPERERLSFACQVVGMPMVDAAVVNQHFSSTQLRAMNEIMVYSGLAAIECWQEAGLEVSDSMSGCPDWDTGVIFATGVGGIDTVGHKLAPNTDAAEVRKLGSAIVEQVMCSAPSAFVGGILGLGGPVSTNSSACCSGTEAILLGLREIQEGRAERMLVGGAECSSYYVAAGFDAMRVLARGWNTEPARASRPLSATANGFVPSAGAGALLLESLESAQRRSVRIYAEVLGGANNCGGQRNGGSMSASNYQGVERCITMALQNAKVDAESIGYINGHLTATGADIIEIRNLERALGRHGSDFPYINSTKSMIGHALGASGAIESVATVLQIFHGFLHPSINCDDIHPAIEQIADSVVRTVMPKKIHAALKTSFGFGDVNACIVFGSSTHLGNC